jgi:hypothetical protein
LLGDGYKGIEIVYGEEKFFLLGALEQPKQIKSLWYRHDKPNELTLTKKGPLSFVLFESPFTSVSRVSRGPPLSGLSEPNIAVVAGGSRGKDDRKKNKLTPLELDRSV